MSKINMLILSLLTIFSISLINAEAIPSHVQKKIETSIENSGFKNLLKTRQQLASGNNKGLL
ncbi:MAG: hypothetical protein P4L22_00370, partial [Candidatus Babeliales bacterium]|nr:hypothetical protein [Candidatus Babeliales bacterium]